jgi:hypothetical protein
VSDDGVVIMYHLPGGGFGGAFDLLAALVHAIDLGTPLVRLGAVTVPPAVALADLRSILARDMPGFDVEAEIRDHVRRKRAS